VNRFVKTFIAAGTVGHRRLATFNANDGEIAQATGPTQRLAGVVDFPGGATVGQRVDVVLFGDAEVDFGGTVLPGAYITSDADGKAVAAAPAAGVNNFLGGRALVNAVSGDIARTFINPGMMQGA
jgi:hypothetical protein